jgi:hypothetical protein
VAGEHPALSLARNSYLVAQELQTYVRPEDPFPWALTSDDRVEILAQVDGALKMLGKCVDYIARTAKGDAQLCLGEAASLAWQACNEIANARDFIEGGDPDHAPGAVNQPVQSAASNFPVPMTGAVPEAAEPNPVPPAASARTGPAAPALGRLT